QPIMEFYFERAQKQGDTEKVEGKKTICSYFLPKIKNLVNAIDREYWLEKLSQYVKINQKVLEEELAKVKTETVIVEAFETKDPKIVSDQPIADNIYHFLSENVLTRRQILSQRVFSLGLQNPDLLDLVLTLKPYLSEEVNYLMSKIRKEDTWILKKEELKSLNLSLEETARLDFFFLKGDFELELLDHLEIDPEEEIKSHLKDIKNEFIKEQMEKLNMEIKACENSPDKEKMVKLIDDFQKLSQDLTKE
ncbi:MAG: hypothetical protein NTW73_02965, partial [Candidatus Parcubacteria bacterium]|nr:hypothetical protein [Candidatus Parcubacteria bacterium]